MPRISTLREFKGLVQANLERNEESLQAFGKTSRIQLKAYLIESTLRHQDRMPQLPESQWTPLDASGWFTASGGLADGDVFLDASSERVWRLYSLLDAKESDGLVDAWISKSRGLDYCWLSRRQLLGWEKSGSWTLRGMGLRFEDGLTPEDEAGNFSLKAWHGAYQYIPELQPILDAAKEKFAIHSVRWQKRSNGSVLISAEWYSNGKVTINRGVDVDEVLASVTSTALRYSDSLMEATRLRNSKLAAFEFDFSQRIDLDAFTKVVKAGAGEMRLWLMQVSDEPDLRRFKGVDLHTWDRVLVDVGPDFAYLSVPREGCVNAVPRLAVVQGEDNSGKTEIFYDGIEVFD